MTNALQPLYQHLAPLCTALDVFVNDAAWASLPFPAYSLDLGESADAYLVRLALPGVRPEAISLSLAGRTLDIHARWGKDERHGWLPFRRARPSEVRGAIREQIILPGPTDANSAEAEYVNGILTVRLPKAAMGRRIPIQFRDYRVAALAQPHRETAGRRRLSQKLSAILARLRPQRRDGPAVPVRPTPSAV
jgi:HSP20 family protein